jgi:diguanylate cyclase (GGDEF)-like protein
MPSQPDTIAGNRRLLGIVWLALALQALVNLFVVWSAASAAFRPLPWPVWVVAGLLAVVATRMAILHIAERIAASREAREERFYNLLRHDGLTGALTRSFFLDRIRAEAIGGALLVIDVDHFKSVNDRFGHYSGDAALTHLATAMIREFESGGYVGRLGGEEFAIYLPGIDFDDACTATEALRGAIEANEFEFDGQLLTLTVSIGLAMHETQVPIGKTLRVADDNLYAAKKAGRNCVATHNNPVILLQERIVQSHRRTGT